MNYWELRKEVKNIIPRMSQLFSPSRTKFTIKQKGRKSGYHQFNIKTREMVKQERLLNNQELKSFVEISLRAAACPMPFNLDVWDGLLCPYNCIYCFANSFRESLYTSFFDNSKTLGFRHCNPTFYKQELDKLFQNRRKDPHSLIGIAKAACLEIPLRFGIRFEDFLPSERRCGISLELLRYLKQEAYPTMINTKSDLVGRGEYVKMLSENEAGVAVHITMISSDEFLLRNLEPGAPTFAKRIHAAKNLISSGVRVVARIEPYLVFINDEPEEVESYIQQIKEAGIQNITFDTYSYSSKSNSVKGAFIKKGWDFDRMFLLGCDSQALGSLLLGKFMDLFQQEGISCSTFDMGNMSQNNQDICCEVGDWFKNNGFNWGSTVMAARYIIARHGLIVSWKEFSDWVNKKGGFLTPQLELEVHKLWNLEGNHAYSPQWASGLEPVGIDQYGILWKYNSKSDFRENLLKGLI